MLSREGGGAHHSLDSLPPDAHWAVLLDRPQRIAAGRIALVDVFDVPVPHDTLLKRQTGGVLNGDQRAPRATRVRPDATWLAEYHSLDLILAVRIRLAGCVPGHVEPRAGPLSARQARCRAAARLLRRYRVSG